MLAPVNKKAALSTLLAGRSEAALPACEIHDVIVDSRAVTPGALFLACAGARGHGLDHAAHALSGGAAAIAYEPTPDLRVPTLGVPLVPVVDLGRQAGAIAATLYDYPSAGLLAVGVTGTDGKTSCSWLIAQALRGLSGPCGYLGTLGFGDPTDLALATHTTPDATRIQHWLARMQASSYSAVAMEVSSHALAQHRVDAVAFDIAVLTQIGRDHLDYHGSDTAYIAAKRRLFDYPGLGHAVINHDDATGRAWLVDANRDSEHGPALIAYGREVGPAVAPRYVRIDQMAPHSGGLRVVVSTHVGGAEIATGLVGLFNAHNLAACLAVLLAVDIPLSEAAVALGQVTTVPGRMERIGPSDTNAPLVLVDYAHTAGALEAALASVRAHARGRVLCVFGCGGDRDRGKRALMGAASAAADYVWLTDDNPRSESPAAIVADIIAGLPAHWQAPAQYCVEHRRARAIEAAIAAAGPDDVVLIAGKGHERTQQYGSHIYDFDDRVAAARALEVA